MFTPQFHQKSFGAPGLAYPYSYMELVEIKSEQDVQDADVRERAKNVSRGGYTKVYVARDDGQDVALVALDFFPKDRPLWLYDVLVPKRLRRGAIGSRVLREVERFAAQLGYRAVSLTPKSLDAAFPQEALVAWYERNGYQRVEHQGQVVYSKHLTRAATSASTSHV